MALYKDGNPVSGINSIPRLTLAQYNALNVKPEFWVRTDAPESYKKLSADQVSYDSNNTVEDMIDELSSPTAVKGTVTFSVQVDSNSYCYWVKKGKVVFVTYGFTITEPITNQTYILSGLPEAEQTNASFDFVILNRSDDGTGYRVQLLGTNMRNYYGRCLVQNAPYTGSFCYICK